VVALPYSSPPVRSAAREAVIKLRTEESGTWCAVKTTELTSEDHEHVCTPSVDYFY